MMERRRFERFSLKLPTRIEVVTPAQEKDEFDLLTSDVSAGGAFFYSATPIPKGTRVRLNLTLSIDWLKKLTGAEGLIEVGGTVVRSSPEGMAICFDEDYHFVRLGSFHW